MSVSMVLAILGLAVALSLTAVILRHYMPIAKRHMALGGVVLFDVLNVSVPIYILLTVISAYLDRPFGNLWNGLPVWVPMLFTLALLTPIRVAGSVGLAICVFYTTWPSTEPVHLLSAAAIFAHGLLPIRNVESRWSIIHNQVASLYGPLLILALGSGCLYLLRMRLGLSEGLAHFLGLSATMTLALASLSTLVLPFISSFSSSGMVRFTGLCLGLFASSFMFGLSVWQISALFLVIMTISLQPVTARHGGR